MVEPEKMVTVGDNPLCINDISIYLWEILPIDKCLTCCVSGRYSPRPDTKGGGGIGKHPQRKAQHLLLGRKVISAVTVLRDQPRIVSLWCLIN